eukprot:Anaeramoba_ignava/a348_577.p1 GENE.a348_577~~a348_577.p1  ORF type:complete len:262 (-),score=101.97 a348_577:751-1506(-)
MAQRKQFYGGNWKMNLITSKIENLLDLFAKATLPSKEAIDIVIAPPDVYLTEVNKKKRDELQLSAQNCYKKEFGAFTGETSAVMLKDIGVEWVILGHSERRHVFNESDELVAEKTLFALEKELKVILCIGETLKEREAGETNTVCFRQLEAVSKLVKDWSQIVVAYEPVWAIGTGKTPTPDEIEQVHKDIREWISKNVSEEIAKQIRIVYGGSVNAKNCKDVLSGEDVDGALVGGASLNEQFLTILKSKEK